VGCSFPPATAFAGQIIAGQIIVSLIRFPLRQGADSSLRWDDMMRHRMNFGLIERYVTSAAIAAAKAFGAEVVSHRYLLVHDAQIWVDSCSQMVQ